MQLLVLQNYSDNTLDTFHESLGVPSEHNKDAFYAACQSIMEVKDWKVWSGKGWDWPWVQRQGVVPHLRVVCVRACAHRTEQAWSHFIRVEPFHTSRVLFGEGHGFASDEQT